MTSIGIASADHLRADRNIPNPGTELWGGSGWARIGQYIPYLREAGFEVTAGILWRHENQMQIQDEHGKMIAPDIVICQRLMLDGISDIMKEGKAKGQVVINDVDDWYWGLDPRNNAFNATHPKLNPNENLKFYSENIAASSLVTVSTPFLASKLGQRGNVPVVTIPNYVDNSRFSTVTQLDGTPLFGWAGSTAHRSGDLETVAGVLRPQINAGNIRMHHSGYTPTSTKVADLLGVDEASVSTTELVDAQRYPSILTFEVGIIPLRDTPFNHAKSDIKGLEYAACGIPFIAQDLPSYQQLHKDWGDVFHLASRPKDWIRGIKRYASYENRLHDQAALLEAATTRDITIGAQTWVDLLNSLK